MTDEQMDARLRAAGAAWRAATDAAPTTPAATDAPVVAPSAGHPPRRPRPLLLAGTAAVVAAALVGGGLLLLAGRGADRSASSDVAALEGTVWQLLGYGDRTRTNSTATFYVGKDGRLIADDSCTLVTARAAVDGGRLRVTGLTERHYNCTDAAGEVTFVQGVRVLRSHPGWSVDGGRLTITGAGTTMHLAPAAEQLPPTADRPTYTDAGWSLISVRDAGGAPQEVHGVGTFRISGGRLTASDTCNTITGRVRDLPRLRLTGLAMTEIGCADGTSTTRVVDRVLTDGATMSIAGATLTVTKAGAGTLGYRWQPDDHQATDPRRFTATAWRLHTVAGAPAGIAATVRATSAGGLTVDDSCSTYPGRITLAAGSFTTAGLPEQPARPCAAAATTLLSFLHTGGLWSIQRGKLLIYGGTAQAFALVFDPATHVPASTVELTGKPWTLTGIEETTAQTASGRSTTTGAVLRFDGNGGFRLSERCAEKTGRVRLTAANADFTGLHDATFKSCPIVPPQRAAAERTDLAAVHKVLAGAAAWQLDGGTLRITRAGTTLDLER